MEWLTIITENNSVYRNLGDGKTQRFKRTTSETCAVQDMLVFIEPMDFLKLQLFLQAIQLGHEYGKVYVIDKTGKTYDSVDKDSPMLKLSILKDNSWTTFANISLVPQIGWYTFDQRRFVKDGKPYREYHLGNKVIHFE